MYNIALQSVAPYAGYCGGRTIRSQIASGKTYPEDYDSRYLALPVDDISRTLLRRNSNYYEYSVSDSYSLFLNKDSLIADDLAEQLDTIVSADCPRLNVRELSIQGSNLKGLTVGKRNDPYADNNIHNISLSMEEVSLLFAKSPKTHLSRRRDAYRNNRLRKVFPKHMPVQASLALMKLLYMHSSSVPAPRYMNVADVLPLRYISGAGVAKLAKKTNIDNLCPLYITLLPTFNNPAHNHEACGMVISTVMRWATRVVL